MSNQNYEAISADFNTYLLDRFNYRKPMACLNDLGDSANLSARRKHFDIYIRFIDSKLGDWNKGTIVIAKVEFSKTRVGHGTGFLSFLCSIAAKYGYSYIEIESANENSSAFARKFGFQEIETKKIEGLNLPSHFIIPIDKLDVIERKDNIH